ncbi:MAG: 5'-deoxyadenosine deaminase [Myxococcota bacterium]
MTGKKTKGSPAESAAGGLLIRGGWVVTMDASDTVGRLDVRIADGRIVEIGEKLKARGVARLIDAKGVVVMPGLVQAHVHLCQSLFRAQAEDVDLLTWLRERIWPLEGALEARDMRAAVGLGLTELLLGGTTCILDMGTVRHGDIPFEEAKRFGIRFTGGKAIMDQGQGYPAGLRETTDEAIEESVRLCDAWHGAADGRLRYAFSPRFALSCSKEAIRRCVEEARRRGALLHTHAAENSEEVALVRERTQLGNIEYLHSLGFTGEDVLLAHCIWISVQERRLLRETKTRVIHCPSANLKLGSGIARIAEMLDDEIMIALGADGVACNNTLDGFFEMRLAALLHRARGGPQAMSAKTALRLATRGGALALGLTDVGSIEVGHQADLTLLDFHRPHVWPNLGDLHSRIVFSARSADVQTVIVGGKTLVDSGELCTGDLAKVLKSAQSAAERVTARVD